MIGIPRENFDTAMRLLGLDPDNPERPLLKVQIKEGRVRATYGFVLPILPPDQEDEDDD